MATAGSERVQRADELAKMVADSPSLQEEIKANPVLTISNLVAPLQSDVWIYRIVVSSLSLVAIVAMFGTIVLANETLGIPDALISLGSAAVGALAGLLAPSPRAN